jgi:hypothetical protein
VSDAMSVLAILWPIKRSWEVSLEKNWFVPNNDLLK